MANSVVDLAAVRAWDASAAGTARHWQAMDAATRHLDTPLAALSLAALALPGWHGIRAYALPEALWLAETRDDVVVAPVPRSHARPTRERR